MSGQTKLYVIRIKGMTCEGCARTISEHLQKKGILHSEVDFSAGMARVELNPEQLTIQQVVEWVNSIGPYRVTDVQEYDSHHGTGKHLVILGGGSAAFAAAIAAKDFGVQVTMINAGLPPGGTCVNVGCVPSKLFIRAAEALQRSRHVPFPGIEARGKLKDFRLIVRHKQHLVKELRRSKYTDLLSGMDHVNLVEGWGTLVDGHTVEINGRRIQGDAILIATGARPSVPPIPGLDEVNYLTNETVYELQKLPESLIVLGGNYIGLENAQLFARFGVRVTVVELLPDILPSETPDVAGELRHHLEREGIRFVTSFETREVRTRKGRIILEGKQGNSRLQLEGERLLVATGRSPNTERIGADRVDLPLDDRGFLKVDPFLETKKKRIFGAGDVIGPPMFVYAAAYEGKLAVQNAFSGTKKKRKEADLPWVIFTDPQVAGVGLDERQAAEKGLDAEVAVLSLKDVPRSIVAGDTRGFLKLIRDRSNDRLLGARIVAPEGGELVMELAMAIRYGIPVAELRDMPHPYLTLSEGIKLAAITFSRPVNELSCCAT